MSMSAVDVGVLTDFLHHRTEAHALALLLWCSSLCLKLSTLEAKQMDPGTD